MTDTQDEDELKDPPFNPWRFPSGPAAEALIRHVQDTCEAYEEKHRLRIRARRAVDRQTFLRTVEAVICDLIHSHYSTEYECIRVSRSKTLLGSRSRYRSPVHTKVFPDVLDLMTLRSLGWIDQKLGEQGTGNQKRQQTTIWVGPTLLTAMETFKVDLRSIRTIDQGEVIVLKREKTHFWDDGEKIEYDETPETAALRKEVTAINDWLNKADIAFTPPLDGTYPIDTTDRRLRRVFTQGRFDCGGRLFGGFRQPMGKHQRLDHILIDGDRVAELDYGQMVLRTLYGLVGIDPGDADLYLLPGLEAHRIGVKKVLNVMVSFDKPLLRFPRGTRALFPAGMKVTEVTAKIEERHRPVGQFFHVGFVHQQQLIESNILIEVLRACEAAGIVALPIHDAIIVPETRAEQARDMMLGTFLEKTGIPAKVDLTRR